MYACARRLTSELCHSPSFYSLLIPTCVGMVCPLPKHGVVQGSHLGLEIDDSTFRSVQDTSKRSKVCSRHFWVRLRCFTLCLRVVYFPDLARPRPVFTLRLSRQAWRSFDATSGTPFREVALAYPGQRRVRGLIALLHSYAVFLVQTSNSSSPSVTRWCSTFLRVSL